MPLFTGQISKFKFSSGEFTDAVKKAVIIQMRNAARQFVRAALVSVSGSFPVDSGMAKGSFLNLGRLLRVAVPISPKRTNLKYYGAGARGRIKTPELGAELSTQYDSVEDVIKENASGFVFSFDAKTFHYLLNEFYSTRQPDSPWNTFEAGRRAFMESIKGSMSKMPRVTSFLDQTTISFGQGTRGNMKTETRMRRRVQETVEEETS